MADLKTPERNPVIGRLADILLSGKKSANTYEMKDWVPLVGGMGLGDMFMGKAPELADDASYNLRSLIRGGNQATGGLGTYTLDPRTADAAMLGTDVAGIGAGLGGLSKRSASAIYDKLASGGTSLSRRDALKKLGAITGGAAVTGGTLGAARKLLDNVATDVAPKIADNVAVQAAKKYKFNSIADYLAYIRNRATDEADIQAAELGGGFSEDDLLGSTDEWTRKLLHMNDKEYQSRKTQFSSGGTHDPEIYQLSPGYQHEYNKFKQQQNEFSPQAKQEMKDWKAGVHKLNTDYGSDQSGKDWADWLTRASNDDPNKTLNFLRDYVKDVPF